MRKYSEFRLLAMILSLVLVVGSISWLCVSADDLDGETDEYTQAMMLLSEIGVVKEGMEYERTSQICREDLAVYVAKLIGAKEEEVDCRYFIDVPAGSYGTWAINYLTEMEVFSTNSAKLFYPENIAGIDEFYKVLTTILGYGKYAEARGGYPMGYRMAASTADIDIKSNAQPNFETLMILLYRAAKAELYESVYISGSHVGMGQSEETLLSVYHNIKSGEGTVESVGGMTVLPNGGVEAGNVSINQVVYKLNADIHSPDYLGEYVEFFYKDKDAPIDEIVAIFSVRYKEDIVVSIEDIDSITEMQLTYGISNTRSKKVDISGMKWIYNGRPLEKKMSETLSALNKGSVTLRDTDNDGSYDTVIVWNYNNFVVSANNTNTKALYNILDGGGTLVYKDYEEVFVFDELKNPYSWEDIAYKSVLSVAESKDKEIITIIVALSEFNGTLTGMGNSPKHISVNGETYMIEPSYVAEFESIPATIGTVYYYKTDFLGNIAYVYNDPSDNAMKYAYITGSDSRHTGFDHELYLRLLCYDDTINIYKIASRVRVDGKSCKSTEQIMNELKNNGKSTLAGQMIRYELNANEEIKTIDTTYLREGFETENNSLCVVGDENFTLKWYQHNRLGMLSYLDGNQTYVFAIPNNPISGGFDPEEYKAGTVNSMWGAGEQNKNANVYTASGRSEYVDAVVYGYDYANLGKNSTYSQITVMMVDEIINTLDKDGNVTNAIIGMVSGSETEVVLPENVSVDGIGEGDIIQLRYGIREQIVPSYDGGNDIILLYDYSEYQGGIPSNWAGCTASVTLYESVSNMAYHNYRHQRQLSFGFVSDKSENCIWWGYKSPFTLGENGEEEIVTDEMFKVTGLPIVVYDGSARDGQKIYKGSIADIDDYNTVGDSCSTIILHTGVGVGRALFVYK